MTSNEVEVEVVIETTTRLAWLQTKDVGPGGRPYPNSQRNFAVEPPIPVEHGQSVVLCGPHMQLPPHRTSPDALLPVRDPQRGDLLLIRDADGRELHRRVFRGETFCEVSVPTATKVRAAQLVADIDAMHGRAPSSRTRDVASRRPLRRAWWRVRDAFCRSNGRRRKGR